MSSLHKSYDYLKGEKFSNSYDLNLLIAKKNQEFRFSYLAKLAQGRNLIHFGCVDHLPLIHKKIEENLWLHKILSENANRCFGVDINSEGIKIMKKLGYTDLVCADITLDDISDSISDTQWDYIIMGEILEHVDNPISFLQALHSKYKEHTRELIITVPNAFRLQNFINSLKYKEQINSDHRYWFSPYTLMKVVTLAGFSPTELVLVNNFRPASRISRFLNKKYPLLRETLVLHAKF